MSNTVEEIKAELAALETKQPEQSPAPVTAQPFTPAPAKRRFTETEQSQLAHLKAMLEELKQPEPQTAPNRAPAPTPEQSPAPVTDVQPERTGSKLSTDDYFAYQQWRITRESEGKPASVADWIAAKQAAQH